MNTNDIKLQNTERRDNLTDPHLGVDLHGLDVEVRGRLDQLCESSRVAVVRLAVLASVSFAHLHTKQSWFTASGYCTLLPTI